MSSDAYSNFKKSYEEEHKKKCFVVHCVKIYCKFWKGRAKGSRLRLSRTRWHSKHSSNVRWKGGIGNGELGRTLYIITPFYNMIVWYFSSAEVQKSTTKQQRKGRRTVTKKWVVGEQERDRARWRHIERERERERGAGCLAHSGVV